MESLEGVGRLLGKRLGQTPAPKVSEQGREVGLMGIFQSRGRFGTEEKLTAWPGLVSAFSVSKVTAFGSQLSPSHLALIYALWLRAIPPTPGSISHSPFDTGPQQYRSQPPNLPSGFEAGRGTKGPQGTMKEPTPRWGGVSRSLGHDAQGGSLDLRRLRPTLG